MKGKGKGEGKGKGVVATAEEKNQDNMAAVAQLKKKGKGGRGKCGGKGDAIQFGQTAKATGAPPKAIPKPGKKGTGKHSAPAALAPKSEKKKKGNDDADPDANARTPSKPPNNKRGSSSTETPDKDQPPTDKGRRTTAVSKKPKIAKPSEIISDWQKKEKDLLEQIEEAQQCLCSILVLHGPTRSPHVLCN